MVWRLGDNGMFLQVSAQERLSCQLGIYELVTDWICQMQDWWNELWLNEGFATWVGWLVTDHIHPDWHVWPQCVSEGMQGAFGLDSLRSSHPIDVPVKDALDVDQVFDQISYLKGQ